ncbi:hypothetical protein [Paeniglutamicibacter cryotolerans]|uniref:Uncharacterized protein n=1 Tax=Paeniglutamicibacter cryotolerans TaxID=670079 RepID=A0A839QLN8_9MICC|nr:hypothetical protein [Paeniglutamicibacter cryotolerans]MBB2994926.1 hypothetical protein [Paeniglutamicibacter cryotolerans]MBB2995693.1 hypothetical protein [Paeniglutamicibacter cryotolerans]MBB2996854.1 hypothetical protein [Paeniglutamicibacter cryotolerans]
MSHTRTAAPERGDDPALLAAGHDTGWWDEHGCPAPWPADFWQPDGTINPAWQHAGITHEEVPFTESDNHSF